MNYDGGFILQKNVNWSLLKEGFTINVAAFELFQTWNPSILVHGTKRPIKIRVGDMYYDAMLVNQDFKQEVYGGHRDVLQVRKTMTPPTSLSSVLTTTASSTRTIQSSTARSSSSSSRMVRC